MSADTDSLIARLRDFASFGLYAEAATALEAVEAQGAEESERRHRAEQGWADEARRAEAAEAQRDTLAEALGCIEHYTFDVTSNDGKDVRAMKRIARAALAGVAPPEEQP